MIFRFIARQRYKKIGTMYLYTLFRPEIELNSIILRAHRMNGQLCLRGFSHRC